MNGSDISWAVCKFAPRSRQITMPAPHHSVVVVVVVVTFFNHNFVNCKATLILEIKIMYEIKYNISLNDVQAKQQ